MRVDAPPPTGDERTLLVAFLQQLRRSVIAKAEGIDDEQAKATHPPSALTLGGLLKHLAYVEDSWLQETFAGVNLGEPWASAPFDEDRDWELHSASQDTLEELIRLYREAATRSDAVIADSDLDALAAAPAEGRLYSLRWIVIHLVEETARHAGHADLIREALDGSTGT